MGHKERQEREREATRKAILDAARVLFVEEGYANVSVRKVADRIEYSAAAIYGYFESKDDIFLALAEEGFRLLEEALRERIPPRTYRWLDEFFVCGRCHRIFWHGTHWQRIAGRLQTLEARGARTLRC